MPPKAPEVNPWEPLLLLVGFLTLMLGLLWARGSLDTIRNAGSQGLFIQSPISAPTSPGDGSTQTNPSPATTNNQ